jgi:hypothetical protein
MDESPADFTAKSWSERLLILLKRGSGLALLVSIIAFSSAIFTSYDFYKQAILRAQEGYNANIQAIETRKRLLEQISEIRSLQSNLQSTIDDLAKLARQVPDSTLRDGLQDKILTLQQQILQVNDAIYRSIDLTVFRKSSSNQQPQATFAFPDFVSRAAAEPTPQVPALAPQRFNQDDARLYVMMSVFVVLGATFIVSVIAIFKTSNPEVLKFAFDTVKTLMGFFIGVATAFLGLPVAPHP